MSINSLQLSTQNLILVDFSFYSLEGIFVVGFMCLKGSLALGLDDAFYLIEHQLKVISG